MNNTSDHTTLILLGEIKGTLEQFKGDTERRFEELKNVVKAANDRASVAEDKAHEAHEYAKGVVNRAIYYSMGFAGAFTTILFAIKNKALAAIIGIH